MLKKYAAILLIMLACSAASAAEEGNGTAQQNGETQNTGADAEIGLSAGLDYMSTYLWRGTYWFAGDGAFFPSVSYEKAGFTLSYCGEFSEDYLIDGNRAARYLHATDFGLDYEYGIEDFASVSAGLWYFLFHNDNSYSFLSGSVGINFDSIPLSPSLTYSHDYYTDSGDAKDFYLKAGVSHDFELTQEAAFGLGLTGAYYYSDSCAQKGISDIMLSAGISVEKEGLTLSGSLNGVIVPSDDFKKGPDGKDDVLRFYAQFGAGYSI